MSKISAKLLRSPGLDVTELAARKCYGLEHKIEKYVNWSYLNKLFNDKKHRSVFQHTIFQFELSFTRDVLQDLSRHDVGVSESVRSTRYTLKSLVKKVEEREDEEILIEFLEDNTDIPVPLLRRYLPILDFVVLSHADDSMRIKIEAVKKVLMEGWLSSGIYTFNLQSLENLFRQRLSSDALTDFKELCLEMWKTLPKGVQWLLRTTYQEATGEELLFLDVQEFVIDGYFQYNIFASNISEEPVKVAEEKSGTKKEEV